MQDILKKYKKNKMLSNINVVLASLVLAFGVNFLLIDGTNIGNNLKASVLNTNSQTIKSDISVEKINNEIYLVSNKEITNLSTFSLSLSYNPENLELKNIESEFGDIINLANTPGINSIIMTSENPVSIKVGDKLMKVDVSKKSENTENLNIVNANFKDDNDEHFLLSTSGITF